MAAIENLPKDVLFHCLVPFLSRCEKRNLILASKTIYKQTYSDLRTRVLIDVGVVIDNSVETMDKLYSRLKTPPWDSSKETCSRCFSPIGNTDKSRRHHAWKCEGISQCSVCWKWMETKLLRHRHHLNCGHYELVKWRFRQK